MSGSATLKELVREPLGVMVYHQRIVAYMDVIATMLLLYEIFLNLPSEIDHIWMRKWSYLTVIYIFQRYLPVFDTAGFIIHHNFGANSTPQSCELDYRITGWCFIVGMLASEIILTLRVWALWRRRNSVAIGFILFLLACWTPSFVLSAQYLQAVRFTTHHPLQGCFITNASQLLYLRWVLLLVYDTGTLVMILIPVIAAYREGGRSSLLKTVYEDGVMYYAFIFLTSVINMVLVRTLPTDLMFLLSSFERVVHSILASRAVLHIRQVALDEEGDDHLGNGLACFWETDFPQTISTEGLTCAAWGHSPKIDGHISLGGGLHYVPGASD